MGHSLICFKTKKGEKNQHWDHADAFEASSLMFVTKQTNEQTDKAKQTKIKQQQQSKQKNPAEQDSIYAAATCCFGEIDIS